MKAFDVLLRRRTANNNGWEEVLVDGATFGFVVPEEVVDGKVLNEKERAVLESDRASELGRLSTPSADTTRVGTAELKRRHELTADELAKARAAQSPLAQERKPLVTK